MGMVLDTLAYARSLREAGFSEQQAEGQARALAAAMTDALATKQDLRELEARLDAGSDVRFAQVEARFAQVEARFAQVEARFDARFAQLEASTQARFEQVDTRMVELEKRMEVRFDEQTARFAGQLAGLEHRMTVRLGGMMVAALGAFSALVKLL